MYDMTPEQMCMLKRHHELTHERIEREREKVGVTLCPLQGIYHADQYSSQ